MLETTVVSHLMSEVICLSDSYASYEQRLQKHVSARLGIRSLSFL